MERSIMRECYYITGVSIACDVLFLSAQRCKTNNRALNIHAQENFVTYLRYVADNVYVHVNLSGAVWYLNTNYKYV